MVHTFQGISIFGYGSQGEAWAHCLRQSGWRVRLYLREGSQSWEKAAANGFEVFRLQDFLSKTPSGAIEVVAFLVPDDEIGGIYQRYVSESQATLLCVLAHGFAPATGTMPRMSQGHALALLAPKSIGPKLKEAYDRGMPHELACAVEQPNLHLKSFEALVNGLGFKYSRCIQVSASDEAKADWISEQGLLCGGLLTLTAWTLEEMLKEGVRPELVREECIQELELIVGLLKEKGPAGLFEKISRPAQAGATMMKTQLEKSGVKKAFLDQLGRIYDGRFTREYLSGDWKAASEKFLAELRTLQIRLESKT